MKFAYQTRTSATPGHDGPGASGALAQVDPTLTPNHLVTVGGSRIGFVSTCLGIPSSAPGKGGGMLAAKSARTYNPSRRNARYSGVVSQSACPSSRIDGGGVRGGAADWFLRR